MRLLSLVCTLIVGLYLTGCVNLDLVPRSPGDKPDIHSDEAGLWMQMEHAETQLKTSGLVVNDKSLNTYIHSVICRLEPDHCSDIRVYVLNIPSFNARMAPNGRLEVWIGLLIRTQDEAQLAAILAHELVHFLERHSLQRLLQARNSADVAAFLGLATAAAGVPTIGKLGRLASIGSTFKFSRDQERQADSLGIEMLTRAGYDPNASVEVWQGLLEEQSAGNTKTKLIFFSTHPSIKERALTLETLAKKVPLKSRRDRHKEQFDAAISPYRVSWMRSLFRSENYDRHRVILDRMIAGGNDSAEVQFIEGEYYRLRGNKGDSELAVAAYNRSIATGNAPAEAYRALGQIYARNGDDDRARLFLKEYLLEAPNAKDRAIIDVEIERLQ